MKNSIRSYLIKFVAFSILSLKFDLNFRLTNIYKVIRPMIREEKRRKGKNRRNSEIE